MGRAARAVDVGEVRQVRRLFAVNRRAAARGVDCLRRADGIGVLFRESGPRGLRRIAQKMIGREQAEARQRDDDRHPRSRSHNAQYLDHARRNVTRCSGLSRRSADTRCGANDARRCERMLHRPQKVFRHSDLHVIVLACEVKS